MIQTILVYIILTIFLVSGATIKTKTRLLGLYAPLFLCLLLYSIIFGTRYEVGRDYLAYFDGYDFARRFGTVRKKGEMGFDFLTTFLAKNNAHFSIYFGVIAFIQIFLLAKGFSYNRRLLSFILMSFMVTCTFLSWMNGLRQILALSIFIFSINFIIEKKWLHYFIAIGIASLFHTSALILFPLYLIRRPDRFIPSVRIQILLLSIALIFSGKFNNSIFAFLPSFVDELGYSHYETYSNNASELTIGIGYFVILAVNVLLLILSKKVREIYKDPKFELIYLLYFIGCVWNYLFLGSIPLNRPNYYFYGLNFIVIGYYLSLFYSLRKNSKLFEMYFLILIVLICLVFVGFLSAYEDNTLKFNFFWDSLY